MKKNKMQSFCQEGGERYRRRRGAFVTAWESSFRPGVRSQATEVEAGQRQESLASHWSRREKPALRPPKLWGFRAWHGSAAGSRVAPRIPSRSTTAGRGRARGSRPGRSSSDARGAGCGPGPFRRPQAHMGRPWSPQRASPAARSPASRPPRRLQQSRDRGPSQRRARNLPRPLPPPRREGGARNE